LEKTEEAFSAKPLLRGTLPMTFRKYDRQGNPVPVPDDAPPSRGGPVTVDIIGMPNRAEEGDEDEGPQEEGENRGGEDEEAGKQPKLRHVWIYDKDGGNRGKTYNMTKNLVEKYRATLVPDPNNAMKIPRDAQFLVFDEFGPGHKLSINHLKGLTSGCANVSCLNRKSYGESYVPMPDVQIIILSNYSPYETYAVTCHVSKRKFCPRDTVDPLESRFNIIRLDGDNREEKIKWMEPKHLAEEDYMWILREDFYVSLRLMNMFGGVSTRAVREALERTHKLHKARHPESMTNFLTFSREIQRALTPADAMIVKDVFDRFGTEEYFRQNIDGNLEYRVLLSGDPKKDLHGELVANMKVHKCLMPTFDRWHELTPTGPTEDAVQARRRREEVARVFGQDFSNRPRPSTSRGSIHHSNTHHLAQPIPSNSHGTSLASYKRSRPSNENEAPRSPDPEEFEVAQEAFEETYGMKKMRR
jgi:hypothetical protein